MESHNFLLYASSLIIRSHAYKLGSQRPAEPIVPRFEGGRGFGCPELHHWAHMMMILTVDLESHHVQLHIVGFKSYRSGYHTVKLRLSSPWFKILYVRHPSKLYYGPTG